MSTELLIETVAIDRLDGLCEGGLEPDDPRLAPAWALLGKYAELTPFPFLCLDAQTGRLLGKTDEEALAILPEEVRRRLPHVHALTSIELPSGIAFHVFPLPPADGRKLVGACYGFTRPGVRPQVVVLGAAEANWSQRRLEEWLSRQAVCGIDAARSLLSLVAQLEAAADREQQWEHERQQLGEQIERTYEEITLLHSLTRNLQISRSPVELARLCLSSMQGMIAAAGNVVSLQDEAGRGHFLTEGAIPFDAEGLERLLLRFERHCWSRPLVKNHIARTALGAEFPGLENFVAVPIAEGSRRFGWIVSCNLEGDREFGTVEASLLNSVATILGTHARNIDLYHERGELVLSFVRSLVQTLEARDAYTRGHSDRVALIGRRLAQELGLSDEEVRDIYTSGLLHDIGKIGVDDQVLRKPGRLSPREYRQIQEHPLIGYRIISGLKDLRNVLPGIRNHHECYDGSGYPDGLRGEEIPLMARILAVADAFDAMNSDRPYRNGLPIEQIDEILHRGAGQQWDARVVEAFLRAKADILQICAEYSPAHGDLLEDAPLGGGI